MDKIQLLSQINLFEELPMEELEVVDQMSKMQPVKKGTIILQPSSPIDALFLLKKGQCRVYRMNEQGKQFTLDILVDGNIFGKTANFFITDDSMYIEAIVDTYLCVLGKDEFEKLLANNPSIALKMIEILSSRLKDVCDISEKIALGNVKQRVIFLLYKLSEKSGKRNKEWQTLEIRLTHQDIATMVGSTRETISALMTELKTEGFIKKGLLSKYSIHIDKATAFLNEL